MTDPQPDYDEDGIRWIPTESLYAPPDAVPQQPPTHNLSDLRGAIERGEPVHCDIDQTGLATDGSIAGQRRLHYTTVVIAKECLRGNQHNEEDGTDTS